MRKPNSSKGGLRLVAALCALLGVAAALAACGGGGASTGATTAPGSGTGTTAATGDATYAAMLDRLYRGTYREPRGPVVAHPATGKDVWVVPAGLNIPEAGEVVGGIKEAAKRLGWKVTVVDGKFSPTTQLAGVEQAVAAGANGIITVYIDCATIKNALQAAARAHVPTVNTDGADCDPPAYGATVAYPGYHDNIAYLEALGYGQGEYAVAKTGGHAKVIMNTQTDLASTRAPSRGWSAAVRKCAGCKILGDAAFVGADIGSALQSKVAQQLLKHPDANAFIAAYDGALAGGGTAALKASGRADQILTVSQGCTAELLDEIRNHTGGADACAAFPNNMQGWAAVNYLVAMFAGKGTSGIDNGIGVQIVDKDHNLPPAGQDYRPPVDYRATYERLWGMR